MLAPATTPRRRCTYERYKYRPKPVPTGLRCAACEGPFDALPARRTDAGYVHADVCPDQSPKALTDGEWISHGGVARWVAA